MYQVQHGRPAQEFRWSQPGFIEARSKANKVGFCLPGTTEIIDPRVHPDPLQQLWLNHIVKTDDSDDSQLPFFIAYPNLYLATEKGSVILSHGHYVEPFWQLCEEWVWAITGDDLEAPLDLESLVALNAPLCQLACSGIGQAGSLTTLVQQLQHQIKSRDYSTLRRYLNSLAVEAEKRIKLKGAALPLELIDGPILKRAARALGDWIEKRRETRGNERFPLSDPDEITRFRKYYRLSCDELAGLGDGLDGFGFDVPRPDSMILGHSHRPMAWLSPDATSIDVSGGAVTVYNTGGWLQTDGRDIDSHSAELFLLRNGQLGSERV